MDFTTKWSKPKMDGGKLATILLAK